MRRAPRSSPLSARVHDRHEALVHPTVYDRLTPITAADHGEAPVGLDAHHRLTV